MDTLADSEDYYKSLEKLNRAIQILDACKERKGGIRDLPEDIQAEWLNMPVLLRIDAIQIHKEMEKEFERDAIYQNGK